MCFYFRCICKTIVNISCCALKDLDVKLFNSQVNPFDVKEHQEIPSLNKAPVHRLGDSQMKSIIHHRMSYLFKEKLLFQVLLMTLSLIVPFGFQLRAVQLSELDSIAKTKFVPMVLDVFEFPMKVLYLFEGYDLSDVDCP
ncbi:hypothetical protein V6N11_008323 [Hibiscus sabdariffa]|uniref:Uncharacterized protein n=1 Tax=Hibiscus sabdariffa TaxID=183260 RepID=A0ABR2Q0A2_9ROSI